MVLISTILSDIFLNQDSLTMRPIKELIKETLKESILFPWISAILVGIIITAIFGI
jgi:uncharacterized membrane protein